MEQKDRLEELVNEVDREAQQFGSFDDFLATKSKDGDGDEWKRFAGDAEVSSSEKSSEKVAETDESPKTSSVEPASQPAKPKEETWWKEAPYTNLPAPPSDPAAHPVAPNVTAEAPPYQPPDSIPDYKTLLSVETVVWPGGAETKHLSETQEVRAPESLNNVYINGRNFAVTAATIDEVIKKFHDIDEAISKLRNHQQGIKAGLVEKLYSTKDRARIKELDKDWTVAQNQKVAERIKSERGLETATAKIQNDIKKSAQALLDNGMFETLDDAIAGVRAQRVKKGLPV